MRLLRDKITAHIVIEIKNVLALPTVNTVDTPTAFTVANNYTQISRE